ncbi:MAG: signal peptidase [Rhodospirillales bacterium 20-60-12]|nr:MAG: signal peptidase [Rhodospirillales bacterium 20-60-12]HQT66885.1 S49 family peptidase [Acetobacteraceae bacterium]
MKFPFPRRPRVPVIMFRGIIAARPNAISLAAYQGAIERGINAAKRCKHLILAIESPGGSPVQSDLIGALLRRRADEAGIKIIAVIGDVGASGGYWLACAADEIRANPMSIVGSIGVIGGGFGFADFIARWGIERRVYTAGGNKSRLDPFRPERPEDVAFTQTLLDDIHAQFKNWVRTRRGARLQGGDELFDGSYMLGTKALELGLIDRLGDVDATVKDIAGPKARAMSIEPKRPRGLFRLLSRSAIEAALDIADERHFVPLLK